MIAYWPGKIEAGGESDLVSAFWDYLPTFCDLAGLDIPQNTDGISMVPTLFGKGKQKKHQYLYWEFHEDRSTKQAVRIGDYKIVSLDPHKSKEVYNLKIDPSESNNIVDEQPDLVKKAVEIFNMRTESKTWPLKIEQ